MKRFSLISAFFFSFLFMPNNLWAHGVVCEVKEGKAVIIRTTYDDGVPMSYADVRIFSPYEEKLEFQNGRTDGNGCFAFLPSQTGQWKVVVNDGTGHGVVTKAEVKEAMKIEATVKGWPRRQKLITGISIIWGMTGLIFYFKARKKITRTE